MHFAIGMEILTDSRPQVLVDRRHQGRHRAEQDLRQADLLVSAAERRATAELG